MGSALAPTVGAALGCGAKGLNGASSPSENGLNADPFDAVANGLKSGSSSSPNGLGGLGRATGVAAVAPSKLERAALDPWSPSSQ